jgi:hypothetical protein
MRKYLQKKGSSASSLPASFSPTDALNDAATATESTAAGTTSTPSASSAKAKQQQSGAMDLVAEDVTESLGKMRLEGGERTRDEKPDGTEG